MQKQEIGYTVIIRAVLETTNILRSILVKTKLRNDPLFSSKTNLLGFGPMTNTMRRLCFSHLSWDCKINILT